MPKIIIDHSKCEGENTCVEVCPVELFELKDKKAIIKKKFVKKESKSGDVVTFESDDCIACRACESQCPEGAIKIED